MEEVLQSNSTEMSREELTTNAFEACIIFR